MAAARARKTETCHGGHVARVHIVTQGVAIVDQGEGGINGIVGEAPPIREGRWRIGPALLPAVGDAGIKAQVVTRGYQKSGKMARMASLLPSTFRLATMSSANCPLASSSSGLPSCADLCG